MSTGTVSGPLYTYNSITTPPTPIATQTVSLALSDTTPSTVIIRGPMVQLNWKADDRSPLLTAKPPSTESTASLEIDTTSSSLAILPTPIIPPIESSTLNSFHTKDNLSIGIKIGIGVAVLVAASAFLVLFTILFYKKRKMRKEGIQEYHGKPELEANQNTIVFTRYELPEIERGELDLEGVRYETGLGLPHEMPMPRVVHELAGNE